MVYGYGHGTLCRDHSMAAICGRESGSMLAGLRAVVHLKSRRSSMELRLNSRKDQASKYPSCTCKRD